MRPFDDGYIVRREKRIQEQFVLRGVSRTAALIAVVLTLPSILLASQGNDITTTLVMITAALWLLAALTWTVYRAQTAAEGAIQQEYERTLKLYELSTDKPKRNTTVRLSDDGELVADDRESSDSRSAAANAKVYRDAHA